jgi:hypothetical protein
VRAGGAAKQRMVVDTWGKINAQASERLSGDCFINSDPSLDNALFVPWSWFGFKVRKIINNEKKQYIMINN